MPYTESFPSTMRQIERQIQFPVPPSSEISSSFDTPILKVKHEIQISIQTKYGPYDMMKNTGKVVLAIVISGFPSTFNDVFSSRNSIRTLPLYSEREC